ncbi:MAG TPA: PD-(D/E)XK nuclease family protein [Bacteroidota bacterium]|nr:PD-(D/E)XK nuclease family protein [Bacteroidota bacterium]
MIVPTKRRVRYLTREILRLSPGAVAPALPLHTLESLCRDLYGALDHRRPVIGGAVRTLMFDRAVRSVAPELRYFSSRGGSAQIPRGTFDRLIDVITRLKESGIYQEFLEEELAASSDDERPKLTDVARIYGAYERELQAFGAEDLEGLYRSLAFRCAPETFARAFGRLFPDVEMVSLAGFDEFSVPELQILKHLCGVPGVSVTMMFDYQAGNRELFGHLEENFHKLMELGLRESRGNREKAAAAFFFGRGAGSAATREAADHLARRLFQRGDPQKPQDLRSLVTVFASRSRVHEAETICKLIKRLIADHPDRDLSGICVALYNPAPYTDIMRDQFAKHQIPANVTDRFALARSSIVTAVLALLQICARGFRREDVLRAIGSPYFRIPTEGRPFDAGNLSSVALQIRATAGFKNWITQIGRAVQDAEQLVEQSLDEGERRRAADDIRCLRKARSDLEALEALLGPFRDPMSAQEFGRHVHLLLDRLHTLDCLVDPGLGGDLREKDLRAFNAFVETVDDVASTAEMLEGAGERSTLRAHLERLKAALSQERYNVRERFGEGVLVTSIEETRELPVEIMIVAGLVDGEFPSLYQSEVFLSAQRRAQREQRHRWENRYLFYQAVTNWTEHLYLSYPLRDDENALVRSSFVDALLKTAHAETWTRPEDVPFSTDVSSPEEFLRHFASSGIPLPDHLPDRLRQEHLRLCDVADVERSRTIDHHRGEFEGKIGAALMPSDREYLASFRDRVYSVSQLESYAECPFRFLSESIFRLREMPQFEEGLSPREKGAIVHSVLFEFFRSRRDRKLPPMREVSAEDFEAAYQELLTMAREKLRSLDIPDVFWEIDRELMVGREGEQEGLFRRFLEYERDRTDDLQPAFFEVSFGGTPGKRGSSDSVLSREEPLELGGAHVRGKIDRLDIGKGYFAVIDYKTGARVPSLGDMQEGLSLQLPVYLQAAELLLRETARPPLVPAAAIYYQIGSKVKMNPALGSAEFDGRAFPKGSRAKGILKDETALREIFSGSDAAVGRILDGVTSGNFPLTRPDLVQTMCTHCPMKTICRIQTLRHVSPEAAEQQ